MAVSAQAGLFSWQQKSYLILDSPTRERNRSLLHLMILKSSGVAHPPPKVIAISALAVHVQIMSTSPEIKRALPIVSLVILIGLSAINIFLPLFIVPKFEQIYQDAIPGMPLPGITVFIIAARFPLALVALAWPIAGIITVWRRQRAAVWIIKLGYLYFFLLIGVTVIALFMPMTSGIIIGMSDAPLTSAVSSH